MNDILNKIKTALQPRAYHSIKPLKTLIKIFQPVKTILIKHLRENNDNTILSLKQKARKIL